MLTKETRLQIEGSFKITQDDRLRALAMKKPEEVSLLEEDCLLSAVIDRDKNFVNVEVAVKIL